MEGKVGSLRPHCMDGTVGWDGCIRCVLRFFDIGDGLGYLRLSWVNVETDLADCLMECLD